jgi:hypothetical protein
MASYSKNILLHAYPRKNLNPTKRHILHRAYISVHGIIRDHVDNTLFFAAKHTEALKWPLVSIPKAFHFRPKTNSYSKTIFYSTITFPTRGSVVVKALCYKPEGHGFET